MAHVLTHSEIEVVYILINFPELVKIQEKRGRLLFWGTKRFRSPRTIIHQSSALQLCQLVIPEDPVAAAAAVTPDFLPIHDSAGISNKRKRDEEPSPSPSSSSSPSQSQLQYIDDDEEDEDDVDNNDDDDDEDDNNDDDNNDDDDVDNNDDDDDDIVFQKIKVMNKAIDDAMELHDVVKQSQLNSQQKEVFNESIHLFVEQIRFNKLRLQQNHNFDLNLLPQEN